MREVDGLWTAEFGSQSGWTSGGVMVLEKSRLVAGGDRYYCIGSYEMHGRVFTGQGRCLHFHGPSLNVFGNSSPDYHLVFKGRWVDDFIDGGMHQPDLPGQKLPFRLVWRSRLP